jgi:hypothetical protein
VGLKKPSDFFEHDKKTPLDQVNEEFSSARPEKIENVSEAFDTFKTNLNHIQSLSDFTTTFDTFKENLEKVDNVYNEISEVKSEIKDLIKKEDLDSAMMAQLLFVEESISKIETRISSINRDTIIGIKGDFVNLSDSVESFLSIDVPKYKKLISESEVRVDGRFIDLKSNIEENLTSIKSDVLSSVETLNQDAIDEVIEDFSEVKEIFKETNKDINKRVDNLVEKEFPKYKKFFVETEIRTEEKIKTAIDFYKDKIENLTSTVKDFTENEIPKYNNLLIESKIKSEKEVKILEENVLLKVNSLKEKVESLSENVDKKTNERIEDLQNVIKESREEISSISNTYDGLQKDFKSREIHENRKLESYSDKLNDFSNRFSFIEETLTEDVRELKESLETNTSKHYGELKEEVDEVEQNILQTVRDLEVNLTVNETHLKQQNKNIEDIKEEVQEVLGRLQLDSIEKTNKSLVEKVSYIEDVLSKFNEKTLLTEDNPNLPGDPSHKSPDPLTPLDKNFVTLDQLQNHYRLFINRIQQQIATIGGGGAGFIKDLDDVSFDQTTGTNELLIYNGSKWVGIASTAIGGSGQVGTAGTWAVGSAGIHTTKNVGVGTTAKDEYALYVQGDQYIDGNITVGGTITYEDVKNVDSVGIVTARVGLDVLSGGVNVTGVSTFNSDVNFAGDIDVDGHTELDNFRSVGIATFSTGVGTVHIGTGNTTLLVDGNARVIGVLTVGSGSVTIDGDSESVTAGIVTITNSRIFLGDNVTINASATGINSAPNVLYVAKDGIDSNNGTSIDNAKLTIKSAVDIANAGTVIKVLAGDYTEDNPITLPKQVSIVGDNLREVSITPSNNADLFYVTNGNYISDVSFVGSANTGAIVAFNPSGSDNITQSPYIQNCTNFVPNSIGMRIDGSHSIGNLKSMVVDSYTQYNQGGIGVSITNEGYAQLVSVFTICNDVAIYCGSGGQCDITNSNSSFGNFGLVSEGVGPAQYVGIITTATAANADKFVIDISTPTLGIATAEYNNTVGIVTITTSSDHNLSVGMGITIFGLNFNCTPGGGTVAFPSGNNGYVFNVNAVSSATKFDAYVGTSTLPHTYQSGGSIKINVQRPYDGQVIYFDDLYKEVKKITINNGGSGYTSAPTLMIGDPSESWGIAAQAVATLTDGVVTSVDILSNGRGYTSTPGITTSGGGGSGLSLSIETIAKYYSVQSSTTPTNGITTVTTTENVPYVVGVGTTAPVFKQSRILASGHSFEYVGSGVTIANSLPSTGGVAIQANEIDIRNGGLVVYTSTDQAGNFRIGDGVTINQSTGDISGNAYTKSLYANVTPLILALGGI